ncbi:hypothetical protein [Paeniroseomonas aquatica]
MTPAARLAAAIDLLIAVESTPRRPADATANDFFRTRRYIGGGDRRAIAELAWSVVRQRIRLDWWLHRVKCNVTARMLVAAELLLGKGLDVAAVLASFPGGQYAADPLDPIEERLLRQLDGTRYGPGLIHPAMPEAVKLDLPDWVLEGFRGRFGDRLAEEAAAMEGRRRSTCAPTCCGRRGRAPRRRSPPRASRPGRPHSPPGGCGCPPAGR